MRKRAIAGEQVNVEQTIPMKLTEIKKKFKRSHFLAKLWFWAAVHSPDFKECQFLLYRFPITVLVDRRTWGSTFLSIIIDFNHLEWDMFIPSDVYSAFEKVHKIQEVSEHITHDDLRQVLTKVQISRLSEKLSVQCSKRFSILFIKDFKSITTSNQTFFQTRKFGNFHIKVFSSH